MSRVINLPVTEIVSRYHTGEGTPELGRTYGVGQKTIWRRLVAAGVKLRPRGAPLGNKYGLGNRNASKPGGPLHANTKGYLCTHDREGEKCLVHRGCWGAHHGSIAEGWVVHHINGNKLNNNIENLACMPDAEHKRLHHQMRREARA